LADQPGYAADFKESYGDGEEEERGDEDEAGDLNLGYLPRICANISDLIGCDIRADMQQI